MLPVITKNTSPHIILVVNGSSLRSARSTEAQKASAESLRAPRFDREKWGKLCRKICLWLVEAKRLCVPVAIRKMMIG